MAQRLSPDRRHGDFPARNRGLKGTPEGPMGADRGPPVPPLCEEAVGGARGGREGGAGGGSMGTMGPVSAEPGLSLWDAMSARRGARRGPLTVGSEIRLDLRGEETGRGREKRRRRRGGRVRLAMYPRKGRRARSPPSLFVFYLFFFLFFLSPRKMKHRRRGSGTMRNAAPGGGWGGVQAAVQPGGGAKQKEPATPPQGTSPPHPSGTDRHRGQRVPAGPGGHAGLTGIPHPCAAPPGGS